MSRKNSRRSWLIIKPMSSFKIESGNLKSDSLNFKRKNSTLSAYTYNEHSFSNYKNDSQKNLDFSILPQNMSYSVNISNQNIKINQNSFLRILRLLQYPINNMFDLLKVNYSKNNIKLGNNLQKNSLLKNKINFFKVKINKNGNIIDLYKNSLIDIIKKINESKFELGEFLNIKIILKKLDFNTRFHNLLSNNSHTFKKKDYPLKKSLSLNSESLFEKFNIENNIENEKEIQTKNSKEDEKVLEKFLKKENIENKKENEELKIKIKTSYSLNNTTSNSLENSNNDIIKKVKSFISQDDLNELRKNCLGETITIRRIIYKKKIIKIKKK